LQEIVVSDSEALLRGRYIIAKEKLEKIRSQYRIAMSELADYFGGASKAASSSSNFFLFNFADAAKKLQKAKEKYDEMSAAIDETNQHEGPATPRITLG